MKEEATRSLGKLCPEAWRWHHLKFRVTGSNTTMSAILCILVWLKRYGKDSISHSTCQGPELARLAIDAPSSMFAGRVPSPTIVGFRDEY
jgi:hypothetical protein